MDITVSSPGSPGTSFTDNVKDRILLISDVLETNQNFSSVRDLGTALEKRGLNWNYARNILPFLRNCGMVQYQDVKTIENKYFFTNIGNAYVDILRVIKIVKTEPQNNLTDELIVMLEKIQEIIYFQCLVIMMKNPHCNYGYDFFDVLWFVEKYGSIDSTEYLLIQYERSVNPDSYMVDIGEIVKQYRNGTIVINVTTKTKNNENGKVNSFPYVNGNFIKAGVFFKGNDNRYYIVNKRMPEIIKAIREVKLCLNLAKKQ